MPSTEIISLPNIVPERIIPLIERIRSPPRLVNWAHDKNEVLKIAKGLIALQDEGTGFTTNDVYRPDLPLIENIPLLQVALIDNILGRPEILVNPSITAIKVDSLVGYDTEILPGILIFEPAFTHFKYSASVLDGEELKPINRTLQHDGRMQDNYMSLLCTQAVCKRFSGTTMYDRGIVRKVYDDDGNSTRLGRLVENATRNFNYNYGQTHLARQRQTLQYGTPDTIQLTLSAIGDQPKSWYLTTEPVIQSKHSIIHPGYGYAITLWLPKTDEILAELQHMASTGIQEEYGPVFGKIPIIDGTQEKNEGQLLYVPQPMIEQTTIKMSFNTPNAL